MRVIHAVRAPTWRLGLIGAMAVLMLACESTAPSTRPTFEPVTSAPSVQPGDPADPTQITIDEQGFTAFSGDGADFASFAVILTNPNSNWTVFRSEVFVDFFDANDTFIAGEELFVVLLPGQTSALAGEAFGAGAATRMAIGLPDDTTAFQAAEPTGERFDVESVSTEQSDGLNITRGELASQFADVQRLVGLAAVYRDAGGTIVGGAVGGIESIDPGARTTFEIIDGAPHADLGATEVYWQLSGISR